MLSPLLVTLFLALVPAHALQDPEPSWFRVEGDTIVIEPSAARQAPTLEDLTRLVRDQLDLTILVANSPDDTALRQTTVNFEGVKRVPREQLYDFLQIILKTHRFACVEVGSAPIRIIQIVRLIGEGVQTVRSTIQYVAADRVDEYANRPASLIVSIFPLEHIEPTQAANMLQRFFMAAQLEGFAPLGGQPEQQKALMVIGFGPTVVAIRDLLAAVDRAPGSSPQENSEAEEPAIDLVHLECEIWRVRGKDERAIAERTDFTDEAIAKLRETLRGTGFATRDLRFHGAVPLEQEMRVSNSGVIAGDESRFRQHEMTLAVRPGAQGFTVTFGYQADTRGRQGQETDRVNSSTVVRSGSWRMLQAGSDELLVILIRIRPAE